MKSIKVNSLSEFFDLLDNLDKNEVHWFRGQKNSNYLLSPSGIRSSVLLENYRNDILPPIILGNHSSNISGDTVYPMGSYYLDVYSELNDISKISVSDLVYLQQFGLPTRLLDWTTDEKVALWFALGEIEDENSLSDDVEPAFFIMNPKQFNNEFDVNDRIFNEDEVNNVYFNDNNKELPINPIAFESNKTFGRITNQSGNFTMHGRMIWPIDEYPTDKFITKIIINSHIKKDILKFLKENKINHDYIYPDNDPKIDEKIKNTKEKFNRIVNEKITERLFEWDNEQDISKKSNVPSRYGGPELYRKEMEKIRNSDYYKHLKK